MSEEVLQQLKSLGEAAQQGNPAQLKMIVTRDRDIDALDLQINRLARSFVELRAPLGPDFRYIMTSLEISSNLERIGDCIEYVARHIDTSLTLKSQSPEAWELLESMIAKCLELLEQANSALKKTDARLAERLPKLDEEVDSLQRQGRSLMIREVREQRLDVELALEIVLIANKLESIADITSHIAEGVVFVAQARQIRHEKRKAAASEPKT